MDTQMIRSLGDEAGGTTELKPAFQLCDALKAVNGAAFNLHAVAALRRERRLRRSLAELQDSLDLERRNLKVARRGIEAGSSHREIRCTDTFGPEPAEPRHSLPQETPAKLQELEAVPDGIKAACERAKQAVASGGARPLDATLGAGSIIASVELVTRLDEFIAIARTIKAWIRDDGVELGDSLARWVGIFEFLYCQEQRLFSLLYGIVEADPKRADDPQLSRYVFRQEGAMWHILFDGVKGFFSNLDGIGYIAQLLSRRHEKNGMSALELVRADLRLQYLLTSGDPAMDKTAEQKHGTEFQELSSALEEAKSEKDEPGERHVLAQMRQLADLMQKDIGLGSRVRAIGGKSPDDLARDAVRKAIDRSYKAFAQATPSLEALSQHLKAAIRRDGSTIRYAPSGQAPDWITQ